MRFVIDLDSLYVIESATDRRPVSSVSCKRGDDAPFEVSFVRAGVAEELPALTVLTFGAKESAKYDSEPVVFSDEFTLDGATTTAKYLGNPSFNTVELNDLFAIDGEPANDIAYVDIMAEFTWATDGGAPTTTKTFTFRVHNDVIRGDEGTPSAMPSPDEWLAERQAALTFAGADPNGSVTAAALIVGGGNDGLILPENGTANGKVTFGDGASIYVSSDFIQWNGSFWDLYVSTFFVNNGAGNTTYPWEADWSLAGFDIVESSITSDPLAATHLGQECYASTAVWKWNGTLWQPRRLLTGEPIHGVPGAYYSHGRDGDGAFEFLPFP